MIGAKTNPTQPDVRPLSGGHRAPPWGFLVILALLPISAVAEERMEASDSTHSSAAPAGLDWTSMPEPELQSRLAEVRAELIDNSAELHRLEFQLQQTGRAQELVAEIKPIRRTLGELYEQLDQDPDGAAQLEPQLQALRGELNEKEAERLGLLNQSEAYRSLADRAGALREQLKSILSALPQPRPAGNAEKTL